MHRINYVSGMLPAPVRCADVHNAGSISNSMTFCLVSRGGSEAGLYRPRTPLIIDERCLYVLFIHLLLDLLRDLFQLVSRAGLVKHALHRRVLVGELANGEPLGLVVGQAEVVF